MAYRTKTYITADWTGTSAVDKLHEWNLDRAVMKLYGGLGKWKSETDCVSALVERYRKTLEDKI